MTDIVKRLQGMVRRGLDPGDALVREAADEIERLTAWALEERGKVERLTAALRETADSDVHWRAVNVARVALAALEGKRDDVQCPACRGQGEVRGPQSNLPYSECRYCGGSGVVTEQQANDWPPDN